MAGASITITVDDAEVQAALRRLSERVSDLTPVMRSIGEALLISTRQRIERGGPSPQGIPWAPLSPVTLARKRWDKKLIESGRLLGSFSPATSLRVDRLGVTIGTPVVYAAAQQFGMPRGYAGRGTWKTRRGSFPIPWGDIPPRPFLGVSDADRVTITRLIDDYLVRDG